MDEQTGGLARRDLLRAAALGAAVAATPSAGRAASTQANSRIGLGFIGVGGHGTNLLHQQVRRSRERGDVEVVAVCDVWDRRTQNCVNYAGGQAQGTRDYREVLANPRVDAVVIATPDHWHARQTIDAMRAGKDVYCEKPLTLYWDEARDVARVSRETGRVLQGGAPGGSDGNWWTARDVTMGGGIGPVILFQGGAFRNDPAGDWNWGIQPARPGVDLDWDMWLGHRFGLAPRRPYDPERFSRFRKFWDYSGGLATDLLYHTYAALALAINHELPYRVTAGGGQPIFNLRNDRREVPTLFTMGVDYPSQCSMMLIGSQVNDHGVGSEIRGQKGVMWVGGDGVTVRPQEPFRREMLEMANTLPCYRGAEVVTRRDGDTTVLDAIRVPRRHNYDHWDNFYQCIRSRQQPTLNAERAYKVMVPIALSIISFRQGRTVFFDPARETVVNRNPLPVQA